MAVRTAKARRQSGDSSDPLVREMRILQRLIALSLIEGKTQVEGIRILARTGLDRNEIAEVCGTTPNAVSVRLAEAKRKKK